MTRTKKFIAAGLGVLVVAAVVTTGVLTINPRASTVEVAEAPRGVDAPVGETVTDAEMEEALAAAEKTRAEQAQEEGALYVGDGEGGANQEIAFGADLLPAVVTGVVKDTTAEMIDVFAWNAGYMNVMAGGDPRSVAAEKDECLASYASAELAESGGAWRIETTQACDREVAILVGGPGSSNYNLLGAALENEELAGVVLNWDTFHYGSAGTKDGRGFAFVAARSAG